MKQVDANYDNEATGYNGSLPDTEYNLHCPCMGGPEYKKNYTEMSCAERLQKKTCNENSCERFKGEAPGLHEFHRNCGGSRDGSERRINCIDCGNIAINHGRKLCKTCHQKHTVAGTLDKFKKKFK